MTSGLTEHKPEQPRDASSNGLSEAQVEQRRQAPTTHGAHSYLARTEAGALVTADMQLGESLVLKRFDEVGPRGMVEKNALRFEAAAELLWGHMMTSREAFDAGLKTWGWLASAAVRAWRDHGALTGKGEDAPDAARVLEGLKREQDR
jgi:hypothetical protein